jgi:predicted Zn-dependent peptidase
MSLIRKTIAIFLACLILFPHSLLASTEELQQAMQRFSEKVIEHKLSNGLTILLHQRGVAPIFAGVVIVGVGGVDEVPGQTGISHMLEHIAFKGTAEIGTSDFVKEQKLLMKLEKLAIETNRAQDFTPEQKEQWEELQSELKKLWKPDQFDREYKKRGQVGLNATTSKELTTYFVNFPKNAFEFWAWMESERILQPVTRQFYRERDVVMEERRMRYEDSPGGKLYERVLGVAYLEHPYRNPVIGYESDLRGLLASETEAFQRKYYVPQNIVVSVVGDIDPETAIPVLERYFGRIPEGPLPDRPRIVESAQRGERTVVEWMDAAPELMIAYKKPNYPHADDAPITVFEEVIAGSRISPLHKQLVQQERVATSIGVFEAPGNGYPNLVAFSATPRAPHTNLEVLERFDSGMAEFLKAPPSQQQLDTAKRSLAMSFLSGMDSNMSLASDLARSQIQYGDWRSLMRWFEEMITVTPADVHRVGQKYFSKENRTIGRIETRTEK